MTTFPGTEISRRGIPQGLPSGSKIAKHYGLHRKPGRSTCYLR
jgi:hypothetical protein